MAVTRALVFHKHSLFLCLFLTFSSKAFFLKQPASEMFYWYTLTLPDNKILVFTKLKAFAEDKFNVAKMRISVFIRLENIVGKGENAGYQLFLLFPQYFFKSLFV